VTVHGRAGQDVPASIPLLAKRSEHAEVRRGGILLSFSTSDPSTLHFLFA